MPPSDKSSPPPSLVQQDIHLERERGSGRVVATAVCARKGCAVNVEDCAHCAHFARIDTHEAGYVLICRSRDEQPAPAFRGDSCEPPDDDPS
ncbi:MAG TPA: hypothetical protein VFZ61_07600 [Polyangiales bacterium]